MSNPNSFVVKQIASENELSHSWIIALGQDFLGFIWIGTSDGLYRYDGYELNVYRSVRGDSTTLTGNNITKIYEDSYQNLWVGTTRGINKYNWNTDRFIHKSDWPKDNISEILEGKDSKVYFGTYNGLNIYDSNTGEIEASFHYTNSLGIFDKDQPLIFLNPNEILLNGTHGLDIFNTETKQFQQKYHFQNSTEWGEINGFVRDYAGTIWISSRDRGLFYLDLPGNGDLQRLSLPSEHYLNNGTTLSLLQSSDSVLWIGTENNGISRIDLKGFYEGNVKIEQILGDQHKSNLVNNSIYSLFEDTQGNIWIGTYGGLNLYNPVYTNFNHVKTDLKDNGLTNDNVTAFSEVGSNLWITTDGGINILDKEKNKFSYLRHIPGQKNSLSSEAVYSISTGIDGIIWIGTWAGGLNNYNPENGRINHFQAVENSPLSLNNNYIFSLVCDEQGIIWIASMGGGLDRYNPSTGIFKHYMHENFGPKDIGNNWVRQVFLDSRKRLWLSTYQTVAIMDRENETFYHFSPDEDDIYSLSDEGAEVIFEDSKKHMWFGTESGLNLYHEEDSSFSLYTMEDGLSSNVINAILEDNSGNLWISTNNGIAKFIDGINVPAEPQFTIFDIKDGLQGNKFNPRSALKTTDGTLYFGGKNGYNSFNPEAIIQNDKVPPIVITEFLVFNKNEILPGDEGVKLQKHISLAEEIQLKFNYNVFTINFAALNYIVPEKNQYKYRLEGFEDNWNDVGNKRSATYTNLDPGEYLFRVIASNNSSIWNMEGVELKIKILPPWYRTLWAYLAYLLIISVVVLSYRRFILIRSHLKHELVLQRVEKDKLDHVNRMKTRFFTNISHEFRTPLTLILGPLDSLLSDINLKPKINQQLGIIQTNARRLLRLINQLLDISLIEADHLKLKVSKGDIVVFVKEIASLFRWLAAQRNIDFTIKATEEYYTCFFDSDKIEKISYNLIANAFKYTPDNGKIEVEIEVADSPGEIIGKHIKIVIKDSGVGIREEDQNRIFEPFYRSDENRSQIKGSSGIGLALVKGLISAHKGQINVQSQIDTGTQFTIYLPVEKAAFSSNEIDETQTGDVPPTLDIYDLEQGLMEQNFGDDSSEPKTQKTQKSGLLMLVEDNPEVRNHLVGLFSETYRLLEAGNGEIALELCHDQMPDLVISDIKMPIMDGIELCSQLKSGQNTSHIPIILLTAKAADEDKLKGVNIGADAYFTKPFDSKILKATVKNLIDLRHQLMEKFSRNISLEPAEIPITSLDEKFLKKAIEIVNKNIANAEYSVDTFSKDIGMSRSHLHRKFVGLTGHSPSSFIRTLRMKRAAQLLTKGQLTVSEILYEVGIKSRSYFTKSFKEQFGSSPTDFVAKYKDDNQDSLKIEY